MMIEFIGSTGSGKTMLLSEVQRRLAPTWGAITPFELVSGPLGLRSITHPTIKNLIQDTTGLPFVMCSLSSHRAHLLYALKMLARQRSFTLHTINSVRSLLRKAGMYEIIRRYACNRLVLVDEGIVHSVHNIFVFTDVSYSDNEIAAFVSLLPLPDAIIYIRAPVTSLLKRSLQRSDPPREIRSISQAHIETYLNRAIAVFEQLIEAEEIRKRLLIIENPESADRTCNPAVDRIVQFVLDHQLSSV